jgi:hypothetical protein
MSNPTSSEARPNVTPPTASKSASRRILRI